MILHIFHFTFKIIFSIKLSPEVVVKSSEQSHLVTELIKNWQRFWCATWKKKFKMKFQINLDEKYLLFTIS